jgi:trimethyllysine dioxygenase
VLCRRGEQKARLSFAWLLDHAKENREPETRQRRVVASEVDCALRPLEIRTQRGTLELRWPESVEQHGASRISQFSVAELLGAAHGEPAEDSRVAWDAELFIQARHPSVSAAELRGDMGLRAALLLLREYGVLRLRDMPSSATETRELVERIGDVLPTFYGEIWSTRAAAGQTDGVSDTAYSSTAIRPHTDGTYFRDPPGLQV